MHDLHCSFGAMRKVRAEAPPGTDGVDQVSHSVCLRRASWHFRCDLVTEAMAVRDVARPCAKQSETEWFRAKLPPGYFCSECKLRAREASDDVVENERVQQEGGRTSDEWWHMIASGGCSGLVILTRQS